MLVWVSMFVSWILACWQLSLLSMKKLIKLRKNICTIGTSLPYMELFLYRWIISRDIMRRDGEERSECSQDHVIMEWYMCNFLKLFFYTYRAYHMPTGEKYKIQTCCKERIFAESCENAVIYICETFWAYFFAAILQHRSYYTPTYGGKNVLKYMKWTKWNTHVKRKVKTKQKSRKSEKSGEAQANQYESWAQLPKLYVKTLHKLIASKGRDQKVYFLLLKNTFKGRSITGHSWRERRQSSRDKCLFKEWSEYGVIFSCNSKPAKHSICYTERSIFTRVCHILVKVPEINDCLK